MSELVCNECQCDDVRQMRRQGILERLVYPLVFLYPFLCGRCGRRFTSFLPREVVDEIPAYPAVPKVADLT